MLLNNRFRFFSSIPLFIFSLLFFISINEVQAEPSSTDELDTLITIGTGTTGQRPPFFKNTRYCLTAAIYTAAQIGQGGAISSIALDAGNASTWPATVQPDTIEIWMREVTAATFTTAESWSQFIAGATNVYQSTAAPTFVVGWNTFTLATPFNYNGTSNLMVFFRSYVNAASSGNQQWRWSSYTGTVAETLLTATTTWGTVSTTPCNLSTIAPNIQINIGIGNATNPLPSNNATNVPVNTLLSWTAPAGAASFDVKLDTIAVPTTIIVATDTLPHFQPTTNLLPNRLYHWQVISRDRFGSTSAGPIWSFTTGSGTAPNAPSGGTIDSITTSQLTLHWVDNSTDETYFYILRSTNGVNFATIDSVTANQTSFTNTGLSVNTRYWYRVTATNGNAVSTGFAAASNFTLANVPGRPSFGTPTQSTIPVNFDTTLVHGNPPNTQYAIYLENTARYVQANGNPDTGIVWRTATQWGNPATIRGLNSSTMYTIEVKARNGAGTATAFGPSDSVTTSGGLTGIKTIGGTNPDYATFAAAINSLNSIGLGTGGVTFLIRGGTYNEGSDSILASASTSPTSPVVFKPADTLGVILNITCTTTSTAAISLIESPNVTFDGSNPTAPGRNFITVNALSTSGYNAFRICNGASDCVIKNIDMTVGAVVTTVNARPIFTQMLAAYTPQVAATNDTIINCRITGGYTGIYLGGLASPVIACDHWYIANNKIVNFNDYGISINAVVTNIIVEGNEIYLTTPATAVVYGISQSGATSINSSFVRNWVHDLQATATSSIFGIYVTAGPGLLVANNMISLSGPAGLIYGITSTTTNTRFYYNTVHVFGTSTTNNSFCLYLSAATNDTVENNIFVNDRNGGTTNYHCAMWLANAAPFAYSNNNLIVANNDSVGDNAYAVRYVTTNYNTLDTLRTVAAYPWDANSISAAPVFVSASDLHLSMTSSQPPESAGRPIAGIVNDIDNQTRNATQPDIGCDEGDFRRLAFGTITGTVHDSSTTAPLVANVTVRAGRYITTTDTNGRYSLEVRTGTYDMRASVACFATDSTTNLAVVVDSNVTVTRDFYLLHPNLNPNTTSVELIAYPGESRTTTLTLQNNGNSDLHWRGRAVPNAHPIAPIMPAPGGFNNQVLKSLKMVAAPKNSRLHNMAIDELDTLGGPDSFGYHFIDSAEPTGPTFSWITPTGNATTVTGWTSVDDGHAGPYNIGFTFNFYGTNYTQFYAGSNGRIQFGSTYDTDYSSWPPAGGNPGIYFWNYDMYVRTGPVVFENLTGPNRLVITYTDLSYFSYATSTTSCQIILYETGQVVCQYGTQTGAQYINGIGIVGSTTQRLTFHTAAVGGLPAPSTAVLFYTQPLVPPWLNISPTQGTIAPHEVAEVSIQADIDSAAIPPVTWTGSIVLTSDACPATVTIPVSVSIVDSIESAPEAAGLPLEYKLHQNYPNPFNPTTEIRFDLKLAGQTRMAIYNVQGRIVSELFNRQLPAGFHTARFDASKLAGGVYFYRLESGKFTDVKKMVLVK